MNDPVKAMNERLDTCEEADMEDILDDVSAFLNEAADMLEEEGNRRRAGFFRHLAKAVRRSDADLFETDLTKHLVRAVFALKTPSPDGSEHYRSGWDDGLEAAMDAVRDTVATREATP